MFLKKGQKGSKKQESKEVKETKETKKLSAGIIRLQKDLQDFHQDPPANIQIKIPDPNNILELLAIIHVHKDSIWGGAKIKFRLVFPNFYPIDAPKITVLQKVYHPNLDIKGGVCLPLVREDWLPTYSLTHIVLGLLHLFLNPNPRDPLNVQAAEAMSADLGRFKEMVRASMQGGMIKGQKFQRLI